MNRKLIAVEVAVAVILVVAIVDWGPRRSTDQQTVVLYCAHDAAYAEDIIRRFEEQTGIVVESRFDEEANKSLGLTQLLVAEKDNARCDVFWNNQTLGTIRLREAGVLQPYTSPEAHRIPDKFKDPEHFWTGFAARLRVFLINTDNIADSQAAVQKLLEGDSLKRVTIAKPQFGTTLSHYSAIAADEGLEALQQWHASQRERGIREVRGNSMTRDLVAEGVCDVGYTDTDDAFGAIDAGYPVKMVPIRLRNGDTICMPNSVALIRGGPNPDAGKKLIDFLLTAETEVLLARSRSRQIPLGNVDKSQLPDELEELQEWAADGCDLKAAAAFNQAVLDWLTAEHTGQ